MKLKTKIFTYLTLACLLFVGFSTLVYGQKAPPQVTEDATTQQLRKEQEESKETIRQLATSVQELKAQNLALSKQLDWLTPIAALITLVLLAGAGTSLVTWGGLMITWRTDRKRLNEEYRSYKDKETVIEKREKLIYERQDELYNLSLKKEQDSSERDRHIFIQSTETLTLVNATLKLARDASERASKSLEERLNRQHNELESQASELIDDSKAYKNYKVLVEDSSFRSSLQTLAIDITGLQNNQNMLDKEVTLHPYCSFIRGMDFHLNQHVKPAIKYWKQVKDHSSASEDLKIMALHWIGYEQNNLGDFEDAASNFELAANLAKGPLKYELERLKIESRFFNTKKFSAKVISPEMEALYDSVEELKDKSEEFQKVKSSIAGTLGNIYYQIGNDLSSNGDVTESSTSYYQKAKETFANAPVKNKWIWFGYGEACFKLGEKKEAEACFLKNVKPEAELEYSTRLEPRTKVLGQTTVLICSMLVESQHDNVTPLYNTIKGTLGSVDTHVTVYSQFTRRNVFKKVFLEELDEAMRKFEAISDAKPS
jgi:tetratricopeptide (TPR) repeat protein